MHVFTKNTFMKKVFTIFGGNKLCQTRDIVGQFTNSSGVFLPSLKFRPSKCNRNPGLYLSFLFLKTKRPFLLLWAVPLWSSKKTEVNPNALQPKDVASKREIQKAIILSDELFALNKFQEAASALLPYQDSGDVEVLWRLGRALYKHSQESSVKEPERERLVRAGYDALHDAMERDNEHWAVHKWLSVLLDAAVTYDGIKARVSQLEKVKEHMLRAAELNPKDATTLYMLGSWCYHIADMPWFQRKIAATIFAAPPQSSFEEALHYFVKAEEVQPRFYSQNLLMAGKTLLKLQRPREAYVYLTQARDFPSYSEEDDRVRKEAAEILKNLKMNKL